MPRVPPVTTAVFPVSEKSEGALPAIVCDLVCDMGER